MNVPSLDHRTARESPNSPGCRRAGERELLARCACCTCPSSTPEDLLSQALWLVPSRLVISEESVYTRAATSWRSLWWGAMLQAQRTFSKCKLGHSENAPDARSRWLTDLMSWIAHRLSLFFPHIFRELTSKMINSPFLIPMATMSPSGL